MSKDNLDNLYAVLDSYGTLVGVFTSRSLAHVVALDEIGGYIQVCKPDVDYNAGDAEAVIESPCEKLASVMEALEQEENMTNE